nr:retrovirus-related Pol polyprotein from transposon TNT 1-94 [Tanacetum cinerariifolium]
MFLMGLDESVYGTLRSNILAQDPLPNLNKAYSILIREERVNMMMRGKDEKPKLMALATQNRTENVGEIDRVLIQKGMMLEEDFRLDAEEVETVEWETLLQILNGSSSETMNGKFSWIGIASYDRGDPLRTSEGSNFVPQDNVSSSSQSPVKETTKSPQEEELGRGFRKKKALTFLEAIDADREPVASSQVARLVILGNHQVAGTDYNETFALVVKMVNVRVFWPMEPLRNGNFIKWTFIMSSYMEILMEKCL